MKPPRNDTLKTGSILPTFRGVFLERFLHLAEGADSLNSVRQREAVCRELAWCRSRTTSRADGLKYSTLLLVLRDLLGQGWRLLYRQRSIFLVRPDYTVGKNRGFEPAIVKAQIREAYREERLSKLASASAVRFVTSMERSDHGRPSVRDLIADGKELSAALQTLPQDASPEATRQIICPYPQLVVGNERDPHTGLKLIDIWRYFRYLWAIPYLPTPGRNLFYLVRDAARPFHPVMGIAALGNSVVQMSERDKFIGWSTEGVAAQLERKSREIVRDLPKGAFSRQITETEYLETEEEYGRRVRAYAQRLARSLFRAVEDELRLIDAAGLVTKRECGRPTIEVIRRLQLAAVASERQRQRVLRDSHLNGTTTKRSNHRSSWPNDSAGPLFSRKRARALAELLHAKRTFQQARLDREPLDALHRLLDTDEGRRAVRTALHANKKTKIGCNIMDIIICGAVPPYGDLLGGKLVAMLMASPAVIHDYADRYANQPSEIASKLAGHPVVRPAELVFLGTTSLYHVGSSQYERIRIPAPRGGQIEYEFLGYTEGFGSTALTSETTDALRHMTVELQGMRRVNNIFGEGVSPRLRMIREGLALIGIPQSSVLKHSCPRLIYGVRLANNALEYLRGEDELPHYFFPPRSFRTGTDSIIHFWLSRWLLPRSRRPETLRKLDQFSKDDILLSREISGGPTLSTNAQGDTNGVID